MLIATDFPSPHTAAGRRPGRRSQPRQGRGSSGVPKREAATTAAEGPDSASLGRSAVGYEVAGPEGPLGILEAIRFEHGSAVPFLLVVRDDERMTLIPTRRVVQILRESRRLLLSPAGGRVGRR
jgi:hypothetical protein